MVQEEDTSIDLTDVLGYILKKATVILLVSLCAAVLAAGAVILKSHSAADTEKVSALRGDLASLDEYRERSVYINLDPYNGCDSTSVLEIYDVNFGSFESNTDQKKMTTAILDIITKGYIAHFKSLDIGGLIDGTEDKYVRELIRVEADGSLLTVTAKGRTREESAALAEAVTESILSDYTAINEMVGHKIRTMGAPAAVAAVDQDLIKAQNTFSENRAQIEEEIARLEGGDLAKYAAVAFVGAALVLCACFAVKFLASGSYFISATLEDSAHLKCFGTMCTLDGKNRLFNRLSGERMFASKAEALRYIKNTFDIEFKNADRVLLTSSLALKEDEVKNILDALGEKAVFEADYLHNPDAIAALKEVKDVVLIEKAEKTLVSDVRKICAQLEKLDIRAAGFIEL